MKTHETQPPSDCPHCSHLQPSGTFNSHPTEKLPYKPYRVQSHRDETTFNHGDYDTLEIARAAACRTNAVIVTRQSNPTR